MNKKKYKYFHFSKGKMSEIEKGNSNIKGDDELKDTITPYTLGHMAFGFLAGYIKIPLLFWVVIMIIFELWENSKAGISVLRKVAAPIGGPTYYGDTVANSQCDVLFGTLGWLLGAEYRIYRDAKKGKKTELRVI